MPVRRLLREVDSRELTEWVVFLAEDARRDSDRRRRQDEDARIMGD